MYLAALLCCVGCGTTRDKLATEQLLLSDAVDRAVAHIDFSPLRGETVFLDTQYIKQLKSNPNSFVNQDYIISSLRQQMLQAGCLMQENRETADYIAEVRVGALGTDGHDVNYGLPPSQTMNAAASVVSRGMALPILPEISLARRSDDTAAAKIAVFAYMRETKQPVWQSGLSVARSRAQGRWVLVPDRSRAARSIRERNLPAKACGRTSGTCPKTKPTATRPCGMDGCRTNCGTPKPQAIPRSPRGPSHPSRRVRESPERRLPPAGPPATPAAERCRLRLRSSHPRSSHRNPAPRRLRRRSPDPPRGTGLRQTVQFDRER